MKSVMKKLLALALVALMVLPLLVACAETGENNETESVDGAATAAPGEETRPGPTVATNNYDSEFVAIYCSDIFNNGYYFIEEDEREPGNDLEEKLYERMLAVEDYLGVEVIAEDGGDFLAYTTKVTNTITAGDDSYQLVLTHAYQGVASFIMENHVRPFNDFESINLDADYWNSELMEELAINGNMYCGYNDFCLSNCYIIGFNKDMVKENANAIGDLYQQVIDKKWTLDKFMEYSSLIATDNGDGIWDENDTYGFAGFAWVPLVSFQTAADIPIIAENADGELYISPMADNAEKIVALDEMIYEFVNAEYTYTWVPGGFTGTSTELHLNSGRVMFETMNNFRLITTTEDEVKIGVLPYPMWDEKQEDYKTLSWHGVMMIPTTVQDLAMTGDVIEMFAYYSEDVTVAFYETLLGAKVAEAVQDVQMLDIIWASQTSDRGLVYSGAAAQLDQILYAIPHHTSASKPAYATYINNATIRQAERNLKKLYDTN